MKEILFAGAGGQGVLTAGDIVADIAVSKGYKTTWAPEYGSAMRGGDANCTVKVSRDEMIYNPTRSKPDILLAMNQSSFNKFIDTVKEGGTVIINSDMVEANTERKDIKLIEVPSMTMAKEIKHERGANIIMTAIIIKELDMFTEQEGLDGMNGMFRRGGKEKFEEANTKAFKTGYAFK